MKKMEKRDVKSAAIGAIAATVAFASIYGGKVAVSHASERLAPSAVAGAQDAERDALASPGASAKLTSGSARGSNGDPDAEKGTLAANDNLVAQVGDYRKRIELIAAQKSDLEQKLKDAEDKLAVKEGGAPKKSEFDLSQDDWAQLAKEGRVAYRVPCAGQEWTPSAEKLQKLGLAPQDGEILKDAYANNKKRLWEQIGPLCAAALGGNMELANKIGVSTCQHLIHDIESARDKEAAAEAMTQAAEIRAGLRPAPGPNEKANPVLRMFLALTGANGAFENDLAQSFGPDEAHRLAHASDMCNSDNRWGGGKKR